MASKSAHTPGPRMTDKELSDAYDAPEGMGMPEIYRECLRARKSEAALRAMVADLIELAHAYGATKAKTAAARALLARVEGK